MSRNGHGSPARGWLVGLAGAMLLGAAAPAGAGGVRGVVRLVGEPPPLEWVRPNKDHAVCGSEPRPSGALELGPGGGVKNVVVRIADAYLPGWRSPLTFQMDQRRCTFIPRVLIIPPGATLEVLNSDGILHNFHVLGQLNPSRNLAQPGFVRVLRLSFDHPEIVPVKCDLHGEGVMRAWIVVARHPYHALTGEDGRFFLPDLPSGPHVLEAWHEVLGVRRIPVTVAPGPGPDVEVALTYEAPARAPRP